MALSDLVEPSLQCRVCGYEKESCVCDNRSWCSDCQDYHTTGCPREDRNVDDHDPSDELFPEPSLLECIGYKGVKPGGDLFIPVLIIDTHYHKATLKDVTWKAYTGDDRFSKDGRNGVIEGTIVEGHTTNRLFHAVSRTAWKEGDTYKMDYCHLKDFEETGRTDMTTFKWVKDGTFTYRSHTCG